MTRVSVFLIGLVFCFSLFLFPKTLSAQSSTDTKTRLEERVEKRDLVGEDVNSRIESRKATREARLTAIRQNRIRSFWNRILVRLSAVAERIDKLILRIEERLEKIKLDDETIDVSEIEDKLQTAKNLLAETEAEIENTKTIFEGFIQSDTPKESFQSVKESLSTIKDNLKEIHRLLISVVGDIKGLRVGLDD